MVKTENKTRVQKLTRVSIQQRHGCHRNQIYIHVHLVASSFSLRKTRYCMEPLTSCQYRDIFCSAKNSQSQMYKDVHFSTATDGGGSTQQRCFGFVRNSRPKIDKDVNSEATRMSLVPCRNEFFVLQKTRSHKCTRMYICDEGVAQ